MPIDAPLVTCPTTITGALELTDSTQVGRLSRVAPTLTCGSTNGFPGTAADPSNPHFFNLYRFVNPSAVSVCVIFTLTYPTSGGGGADGGTPDAATDGGTPDIAVEAGAPDAAADAPIADGAMADAGAPDVANEDGGPADGAPADGGTSGIPANDRYLVAFATFDPTNLASGYLGSAGAVTTSPQTMSVTIPPASSIDVVVYAVNPSNVGAGGVGPYTLSCTAP